MVFLETERLQLRKLTLNDAPFVHKLMNTEGWLQFIGDRSIHTIKDAEAYIEKNYLSSYAKHGYGPYLVELREGGAPIGSCGLYMRNNLDYPDVGYAFLPEYGGKGYASEAAIEVMAFAEKLGLTKILGITDKNNTASIRLLEKLGLSEIGTYTFTDETEAVLLFSN